MYLSLSVFGRLLKSQWSNYEARNPAHIAIVVRLLIGCPQMYVSTCLPQKL
jgi:hypothetical protein